MIFDSPDINRLNQSKAISSVCRTLQFIEQLPAGVNGRPARSLSLAISAQWPRSRYLLIGMMFPWGYLYIALGFLSPGISSHRQLTTMSELAPGWIALVWLRNAAYC